MPNCSRINSFLLISLTLICIRVSASESVEVFYQDKDNDGVSDSVHIENSKTKISIKFDKTKIKIINFSQTKFGTIANTSYEMGKKSYLLKYAHASNQKILFGEKSAENTESNLCEKRKLNQSADISSITAALVSKTADFCSPAGQIPLLFQDAITSIENDSENFANCLDEIWMGAGSQWIKVKKQISKLSFCAVSEIELNSSQECRGTFQSTDMKIEISKECLSTPRKLETLLRHEILHSFQMPDEKITTCGSQFCPNSSQATKCNSLNPSKVDFKETEQTAKGTGETELIVATDSGIPTAAASTQIDANTIVQVPRQIAAASIPQPSASDLRVTGGSRSFSVPANSNTFPAQMIRFAENAIMPTTAYASQNKASSAKISASAPVAATKSARIAAATVRPASSRGIASASPANSPASTSTVGINIPAVDAASSTRSGKVAVQSGAASPAKNNASRTSGSGAAGTSVTGGAKPSSTGNSRNIASPSAKIYSTTELVSILKQDSYPEVKKRLQQDEAFIEALKLNAITIYNTKGEQIGSPSGRIIFSDTGNRFIQGK